MNERRALALPGIVHRLRHHFVAREQITAIHFLDVEVREGRDEPGNRSAGRVDFDRDGDGVAVVLDEVDDGQLEVGGRIQRLPEFSLRCCAVAGGDEHHLVTMESLGDVEESGAQ